MAIQCYGEGHRTAWGRYPTLLSSQRICVSFYSKVTCEYLAKNLKLYLPFGRWLMAPGVTKTQTFQTCFIWNLYSHWVTIRWLLDCRCLLWKRVIYFWQSTRHRGTATVPATEIIFKTGCILWDFGAKKSSKCGFDENSSIFAPFCKGEAVIRLLFGTLIKPLISLNLTVIPQMFGNELLSYFILQTQQVLKNRSLGKSE